MSADKSSLTERRKYIRMDIKARVEFKPAGKADKNLLGITKNISAEGIGIIFSADKKLARGTLLNLKITLPQNYKPVRLNGEVRWCDLMGESKVKDENLYNVGVKLLGIDKRDEARFLAYVYEKTMEKFSQYLKI